MNGVVFKTVNEIFLAATDRGSATILYGQTRPSEWTPITADEFYGRVRALAAALQNWGVTRGDRVVIVSENRWEWAVADFAILAIGAVDAPLYPTNTADQIGYMIRDSGAKVAIVSSKDQQKKLAAAGETPALERVVVMNAGEEGSGESFAKIMEAAPSLQTRNAAFDAMVRQATPDELCTIIYTSGTTGEPKGVELTHGNLAVNVSVAVIPYGLDEKDCYLSFLPLSHVFARHCDYALLMSHTPIYYCAKVEHLQKAMQLVRPTLFIGVPRFYEKIRQSVETKSGQSPIKQRIFEWALSVGRSHREEIFAGRRPGSLLWKIADRLVYSKVLAAFGGRARTFISGSAALGLPAANWFADMGIRVYEGYGLTETSPVISANYPHAFKVGSIGTLVPHIEVRLAEDGELETRGDSIFRRYWNKPQETADVFTEDGWFKTGDIGTVDAQGFYAITDRKKELLKTSGGKMISPQLIEGQLKGNVLVGNAAVVGDRQKYVSVLISPNFPALRGWAKSNSVAANDDQALVEDEKVKAEYKRIVNDINSRLAHWETMKRIKIVPEEWTIESGELTPSMKLKRRVIQQKYGAEIKAFYREDAPVEA